MQVNQIPAWAGKNANKATVMNVYAKFAKNYNVSVVDSRAAACLHHFRRAQ